MTRLIPCQRELFDIPQDIHYLNCAYISPLLNSAAAAARAGLGRESHPWEILAADFFDPVDELRGLFAKVIGADADDIAIVPSASFGIATAARNLPVSTGQNIVVLEHQYPSNVYVWRDRARHAGADLRIVPRPDDSDWTTAVLEHLDPATAVAALPNNHWMDGAKLDLMVIGERLRDLGGRLVLDVSQSLGAMPLDVAAIQPDFLATAGYKWMLCPYALSFLYVAPRWQTGAPLEFNGLNMRDARDFPRLAELKEDYAGGARRFDTGERAHFTLTPAASASIRQLLAWGIDNIYATLSATTGRIADLAAELGLDTLPGRLRAGHFVGLRFPAHRFPDGPPAALHRCLAEHKVFVSLRGDSLRITPHLYNNAADIDQLAHCLREALG